MVDLISNWMLFYYHPTMCYHSIDVLERGFIISTASSLSSASNALVRGAGGRHFIVALAIGVRRGWLIAVLGIH